MFAAATACINPATVPVEIVTVYAVVFADVGLGLVVRVKSELVPGATGVVKLPVATVGPATRFLHK